MRSSSDLAVHETDWLGSNTLFFDSERNTYSPNLGPLMQGYGRDDIHLEGLYNYLDFGYSVWGQTPIRSLRFLRHSSRLVRDSHGNLHANELEDPVDKYLDFNLSEHDLMESLREKVQDWEAGLPAECEIILPLSGGFDSRILLWAISNKERVRAYTYGISPSQSRSYEVVRAESLARKYRLRWKHITLSEFHKFIPEWIEHYGTAIHAHGMYHYEFYSKIRDDFQGEGAVLSGIVGDSWAGSLPFMQVRNHAEMNILGLSRGMNANAHELIPVNSDELRSKTWENERSSIGDRRRQTILTIRLKMILLSYLMDAPKKFGFSSWSPYLDIEIALPMLNLPPERRDGRRWQADFLASTGLHPLAIDKKGSFRNTLDYQGARHFPLIPLNPGVLEGIFSQEYVHWINDHIVTNPPSGILLNSLQTRKLAGVLRKLGMSCQFSQAYASYLTLKPIESFLMQHPFIDSSALP